MAACLTEPPPPFQHADPNGRGARPPDARAAAAPLLDSPVRPPSAGGVHADYPSRPGVLSRPTASADAPRLCPASPGARGQSQIQSSLYAVVSTGAAAPGRRAFGGSWKDSDRRIGIRRARQPARTAAAILPGPRVQ